MKNVLTGYMIFTLCCCTPKLDIYPKIRSDEYTRKRVKRCDEFDNKGKANCMMTMAWGALVSEDLSRDGWKDNSHEDVQFENPQTKEMIDSFWKECVGSVRNIKDNANICFHQKMVKEFLK